MGLIEVWSQFFENMKVDVLLSLAISVKIKNYRHVVLSVIFGITCHEVQKLHVLFRKLWQHLDLSRRSNRKIKWNFNGFLMIFRVFMRPKRYFFIILESLFDLALCCLWKAFLNQKLLLSEKLPLHKYILIHTCF